MLGKGILAFLPWTLLPSDGYNQPDATASRHNLSASRSVVEGQDYTLGVGISFTDCAGMRTVSGRCRAKLRAEFQPLPMAGNLD
jgi:hypothetical protein